ncbi:MAG: SMP-30/gluconolactonase/LRE family protein [Gemmatimonadaceae bacterium]
MLFCAVLALPAAAQTGVAEVDSATVARDAYARAAVALGKNDLATARTEMTRAATAWPTQPAYVWGRAIVGARSNDTANTLAALVDYAALGLGRDISAGTLAPFRDLPAFMGVRARLDSNRASLARSIVRAQLPDSTFWPEGMDYDARTKTFYVASVRHRTLAAVSENGSTRELWPRSQPGMGAMFGVRVDARRNALWATTSGLKQMSGYTPADSSIAALLRIDIATGAITRRWNLPAVTGGHVLGDLAVGPNGDVYVTDSSEPVLYRLRPGADTLERLTHPLFRSLQGMAPTPDGRTLYVADYSHGILRVDLATRTVTRLADAPHSTSLGCDGIVWHDGAIVAVQNGIAPARVVRFVLDAIGTRIVRVEVLDQHIAVASEPTIGAIVGDRFVYVANSQWDEYDDDGRRLPNAKLSAPRLLSAPLVKSLP